MQFALIAAGFFFACFGLVVLFVYASSVASNNSEGDHEDHELSLSLARARRREADAGRPAGGAMPVVPAREPGPRDPAIGIDQARAEVRERIHRYNTREVRK